MARVKTPGGGGETITFFYASDANRKNHNYLHDAIFFIIIYI